MEDWQMVITDLDGTLFNNKQEVSLMDMKSLFWLGEHNIIRVIATGRNFFSVQKALKESFPIDYLIFSSGAGVYDWKKKTLLHSQYLPDFEIEQISKILIGNQIDFMIHEMIPDNHQFYYYRTGNLNPDFEARIKIYKEFSQELIEPNYDYKHACQILAVIPNNNVKLFEEIKQKFGDIKVIRATSPLDGKSIWMEIFPESVSKAHGVDWLCKKTKTNSLKTISIGNDYNDIDMLEYTAQKYIVENAPEDIKVRFPICKSNQESGFTHALELHFDFN